MATPPFPSSIHPTTLVNYSVGINRNPEYEVGFKSAFLIGQESPTMGFDWSRVIGWFFFTMVIVFTLPKEYESFMEGFYPLVDMKLYPDWTTTSGTCFYDSIRRSHLVNLPLNNECRQDFYRRIEDHPSKLAIMVRRLTSSIQK